MTDATSELVSYDYALIRVVPDVRRGDATTLGAVLHARRADFLGAEFLKYESDIDGVDPVLLDLYVQAFRRVVRGGVDGGPIGLYPPSERFHWLTAVRSTVLQTTPVRTGLDSAPRDALLRILQGLTSI